jgi:histidine triad (HIT) family protein
VADCLFCKIVAGDIPAKKVHEDDHTVAFQDINPQAPTHVLVIPNRHIPAFSALGATDGETLGHLAAAVNQVASDAGLLGDGFRVVCNNGRVAGQTVDHLHWHVLGGRDFAWPPG